ncbi:unnamed protein product, partial [Pocillopora meandrina]
KSLKATWIKKYLDPENSSKWKIIFNLELGKYGGNEIWSDTFFEGRIVSKDHFLSLPLWQNSLIRINNATVLYKEWLSRSIAKIKHSTDNSNNFISLVSFQNKYEIQIKLLMFFGIIFAIKLLQ